MPLQKQRVFSSVQKYWGIEIAWKTTVALYQARKARIIYSKTKFLRNQRSDSLFLILLELEQNEIYICVLSNDNQNFSFVEQN